MKVFISADIEGVAGVTTPADTVPGERNYAQACQWMTDEVIAAIEGARAAGATEFTVADGHASADNLILDALPPDVKVVRSWPRPLAMMQGVDKGADVAFLIGYHTGAHEAEGVLAHTFFGLQISRVEINGAPATELTVSAAAAGHFGVPVTLVTGDEATCRYARDLLPRPIRTAALKESHGRLSATTLSPARACDLIRTEAQASLSNTPMHAYRLDGPLDISMTFKHHWTAELLSYLPTVARTSAYDIRFQTADIIEALKMFTFITMYSPLPTPR